MKHYQFTVWPDEGIPGNGVGIVDLIGQVQKWQRQSGDKPIIVHCRYIRYKVANICLNVFNPLVLDVVALVHTLLLAFCWKG